MSPADPIAVGVTPAEELARRPRLFTALEAALPARFEGRRPGELGSLDALVALGAEAPPVTTGGLPSLTLAEPEPPTPTGMRVNALAEISELDAPLRGASLPDERLGAALSVSATPGKGSAAVLAASDGVPTWTRDGSSWWALFVPAELGDGEALRERLCDRRSAALLPLLHFLRQRTEAIRWQPSAPRASFLFDDPNLHWPSYGFVKLGELGEHAREHTYHVALATVPLDAWFAHPGALRALKQSNGAISLLVHGNDHDGGELGRLTNEAEATALAAQALRRVEAFGRRTGVGVDRVMVPPHEVCSGATLRGLGRCGFEAISMTRPYPWVESEPHSWLARPADTGPLVGWGPGSFVEGLPLVLRHPLAGRSRAEIALRAFLGQPLVLYGHHEDLLEGPEALLQAAGEVNRLAPATRWCSLGEIAAASFESRRLDARLAVRLLSRRARVETPPGVQELCLDLPPNGPDPSEQLLTVDGVAWRLDEPIAVDPAGAVLTLALTPRDAVDVATVPPPRRRPLALARRLASEGRDRLRPLWPPAAVG